VDIPEVLKSDMVVVAGYGWPEPVNGVYPRTDLEPNHVFVLYSLPRFRAFDNYQTQYGEFIKLLAPDYDFYDTAYRCYIASENPYATEQILTLYERILYIMSNMIKLLKV